jgi:hypothetical protein
VLGVCSWSAREERSTKEWSRKAGINLFFAADPVMAVMGRMEAMGIARFLWSFGLCAGRVIGQ